MPVELQYGDVNFFVTGRDGTVTCYLPQLDEVVNKGHRLVVRPEGLIPAAIDLEPPLPEEITVRIEHGQVIGGTVVDEAGLPIEGVSVAFPIIGAHEWTGKRALDYAVLTDAEGRWRCDLAPADLSSFWIRLSHPLHAQTVYDAVNLSGAALKNQSQVLVMGPGIILSGRVVNVSRAGIEGARVTQYAYMTRQAGLHCFEPTAKNSLTDAEGHFDLGNCDPGTMTLVVEAVGYQTEAFDVEIEAGMEEVEFVLGNLGVLKGFVVDPEEQALAGVTISVREEEREGLPIADWHGVTDARGHFECTEAPTEPIEYTFVQRGFQPLTIALAPTPQDQRITLRRVEEPSAKGSPAAQERSARGEDTAQADLDAAPGVQEQAAVAVPRPAAGGTTEVPEPRERFVLWPWVLILLVILGGAVYFVRSRR